MLTNMITLCTLPLALILHYMSAYIVRLLNAIFIVHHGTVTVIEACTYITYMKINFSIFL